MFMVSYDGSYLADVALMRATEYAEALDEDVTAVSVVPDDTAYAREKEWIEADESFDLEAVTSAIHQQVVEVTPQVSFRSERVDDTAPETIAGAIKHVAGELFPAVVFLGSSNAGQIVTPLTSIAGKVGADAHYDVHIVRHRSPTPIQQIEANAEFYREQGLTGNRDRNVESE